MNVISDTGPIIALAKTNNIKILKSLFERVYISRTVYKELMAKTGSEAEEIDKALKDFITVIEDNFSTMEITPLLKELGEGEKHSIEFAYANKDNIILLMDDKSGRNKARKLKLKTTGTIGVLITAKNKGLVENVTATLVLMREKGYWFTDEIIEAAAKAAGE